MTTLTQLFSGIANAIRSRTGGTAQIPAENFPAEIAAIPTGTDTSDATATAEQILSGRTAYVKGQKITGTLPVSGYIYHAADDVYTSSDGVVLGYTSDLGRVVLMNQESIEAYAPFTEFGDATAADVAAGKLFTSAAGFLVEGAAKAAPTFTSGTVTTTSKTEIVVNNLDLGYIPSNIILFLNENLVTSDKISSKYAMVSLYKTEILDRGFGLELSNGSATCILRGQATPFKNNRVAITFNKNGFSLNIIDTDNKAFITSKSYYYMIW